MSSFSFFLMIFSILLLLINLPTRFATARILLGNETDRLALLSFKDGITNDPIRIMRSWNDTLHFCQWQGITCSHRHQRVIVLNLQSQGLVGSLPPFIGNLSFLRSINLQDNGFQGNIPEEVGRLFRLQSFNMNNNSLIGKIPVNLSHCFNLRSLLLRYNKLEGSIPIEIGYLSKLVQLSLGTNNLTGSIPSSLGNLSSLTNLAIGSNSLEGSIPISLGQLKNLIHLSLGVNILSGMFPPSLFNLSYLQVLSAPSNQLIGSLPLEIGLNIPNIRIFLIGQNHFYGSIPVSLFNASQLEMLDFDRNNFSGKVPIEVGNLKGLQYLLLNANHLGSSGKDDDLNFIDSLSNCTNLQLLDITTNHFGGKLPNSISNLSNQLFHLSLGKNQIFGVIPTGIENLVNLILLTMNNNFLVGSIPDSIGKLRNLSSLHLSGNRISGKIPSSLGNLSRLFELNLSENGLVGTINSNLGKCVFLQILDLSSNNLNGTIPKEVIGSSPQYLSINLANNSLTGPLPFEVGNLINLGELDVSMNKLSGKIPSTIGGCLKLESIFLESNFFQGPIPNSFNSLRGIQNVDFSRNNLSGKIPKDLKDLPFLQNLNLSFNDFEGEVPEDGVFKNTSAFSIVGNRRLCGGILELQLPACSIKKSKKRNEYLALKITIGVVLSLVVLASFLALYCKIKPRMKFSSTIYMGVQDGRVSYRELHEATSGFASTNLVGVGHFSSVYKGILYQDEIPVAVKVLNLVETGASKSFINECRALSKVRHRNLLKILTVCSSMDYKGNDFKALVLEFKPNGSLENWLHPSSNAQHDLSRYLNLFQRLDILIDVASALDYLHNHCETPIVHCDLKSSNILLDDDMTALVADFGLAKFLIKDTNVCSNYDTSSIAIKGTIGYIPPEYGVGAEVSTEGDVYSYGILLLEMFTGKKPIDDMFKDGLSIHYFAKMALVERVLDIVDSGLLLEEDHNDHNIVQECLVSIVKTGVSCSTESPGERMKIKDVLIELLKIKQVLLGSSVVNKQEIHSNEF